MFFRNQANAAKFQEEAREPQQTGDFGAGFLNFSVKARRGVPGALPSDRETNNST